MRHVATDSNHIQNKIHIANSRNATESHKEIVNFSTRFFWSLLVSEFWSPASLKLLQTTKMELSYRPEVLSMIHLQLLESGQYWESDWDMRLIKAASAYMSLTKRVQSFEGEEDVSRSLCESLCMPGSVQLVTSCKSHKPPGLSMLERCTVFRVTLSLVLRTSL